MRPHPRSRRLIWFVAALALLVGAPSAHGIYVGLTAEQVREAIEVGRNSIVREDFDREWLVPYKEPEEVRVTTEFSRLVFAARAAALKNETLSERQIQTHLDRSKGKIQLVVSIRGDKPDFARFYKAVLKVGGKDVPASFTQNERSALQLENRGYLARSIYVFPTEGWNPRSHVTLLISSNEGKTVRQFSIDLSAMR